MTKVTDMAKNKKLISNIKNWDKANKKPAQKNFRSTKAAKLLLEVITTYRPAFYDVFGYDFSGKRRRLIETFVEDPHDKSIDKYYGDELFAMKKSKLKGRLTQELKFGLLMNKILDDMQIQLRSKALRENVHWSVLEIAKASQGAYKEYKKTHPLHKPSKQYKNDDHLQLA